MSDDRETRAQSEEDAAAERAESLRRNYPPSRDVPAVFVDNFYVTSTGPIIRIAFAESAEEPTGNKYRVTVALPREDAKELARIVKNMVTEIELEEAEEAGKIVEG